MTDPITRPSLKVSRLPAPLPSLLTPEQIEAVFARLQAERPNPRTELTYSSPFELLIAVILSAQATDISVNLATATLYPLANTPQAILALGRDELVKHIRRIGLYNAKADNILKTCHALLERYQGQVPADRAALESLPGVGRKTANVVLNTAFGQPVMAVDTHIFRVSNRTGLAPGRNVEQVEAGLMAVIPAPYLQDAHHWLILHGRHTCMARNPACSRCLIADICVWPDKNTRLDKSTTTVNQPKNSQ